MTVETNAPSGSHWEQNFAFGRMDPPFIRRSRLVEPQAEGRERRQGENDKAIF